MGMNLPLTGQTSIYSFTFDELQNAMGGSVGKDFGSMNMEELLKNIWTAEEGQTAANGGGQVGVWSSVGCNLQRQGSVTLPRTLSQKTVDEIWKDMSNDCGAKDGCCGGGGGGGGGGATRVQLAQRQRTIGEITLEEFLVRAGAVREAANSAQDSDNINGNKGFGGVGFHGDSVRYNGYAGPSCTGLGGFLTHQAGLVQSENMPLSVNSLRSSHQQSLASSPELLFPKQPGMSYAPSLSPEPCILNRGIKGRRANGAMEKVAERRQRRMIKNRESAAKSRARKQAYTMELEAEVAKLKEENQELQNKQVKIEEIQKNQVLEMTNNQGGAKRQCLRRTQTGPW